MSIDPIEIRTNAREFGEALVAEIDAIRERRGPSAISKMNATPEVRRLRLVMVAVLCALEDGNVEGARYALMDALL